MSENISNLKIENVEKVFQINDEYLQAVEKTNAEIKNGEFISIVGPSGCGKSTLIRMISGLETPSSGEIKLKGNKVTKPTLDIGMIFQESRLFPWLSIEKNIEFGISDKSLKRAERKELVNKMISLVGLTGFNKALPKQLSGGMQQRASIARGLINNPEILLLDEPFGALDAFTRMNMQQELLKIWKQEKNTMILVTHDIDEAIFLSTRIFIMSERPGTIKDVIEINLKGQRDRSSSEFMEIRKRIMKSLFGKNDEMIEYYL